MLAGLCGVTRCQHAIIVTISPLSFGSLRSQFYSVSVSVALLLAVFGSVTPLGAATVAVSEMEPVVEALMVPVAL
jgi:hypothetical protein